MAEKQMNSEHDAFLEEYGHWVNDEQTRMLRLNQPVEEIEKHLAGGALSYEQRIEVPTEMKCIGAYYSAHGAVLCFSDPSRGWRLIKRGLLYSYWGNRIACRVRDFWRGWRGQKKRAFRPVFFLANEAALALAIARPEAVWLLDLMERGLADGTVSWEGHDFYAAYVVRLYRKLKREDDIRDIPPDPWDWEHPFGDLIDFWDDEAKLAEAIRAMCDYHCQWNGEETEDHEPEFGYPYTIVNPVEIHALEAVRSELGLSTPKVEHELLQSPFYPLPQFAKDITTEEIFAEDDLLRRIVEMNQPWCDGQDE